MKPSYTCSFVVVSCLLLCLNLASLANCTHAEESRPATTTPKLVLNVVAQYPEELEISGTLGTVKVELTVTETGTASDIKVIDASHPMFAEAALETVRHWRFEPALSDGKPVAIRIEKTIHFDPTDRPDSEPQPLDQVMAEYPQDLLASGNKGVVVVEFTIDEAGNVHDPEVVESSHPGFEQAAIAAIAKWHFKPALKKGNPVAIRARQPMHFHTNLGVLPFAIQSDNQHDWPPELRYDQAPAVKLATAPVYPFELLRQRITGSAKVAVWVGPDGQVWETRVLEATHRNFGLATQAMMESWTFEPAKRDGKAIWSVFSREQKFNRYVSDFAANRLKVSDLLDALDEEDGKIYTFDRLNRAPKCQYQAVPVYPRALQKQSVMDRVLVEFVIDELGAVQLPHATKFTNEVLAWAATAAVSRWRFAPPMHAGEAVAARAVVPVVFKAEDN